MVFLHVFYSLKALVQYILQNIFCVLWKKESHMAFNKSIMTKCLFLSELSL